MAQRKVVAKKKKKSVLKTIKNLHVPIQFLEANSQTVGHKEIVAGKEEGGQSFQKNYQTENITKTDVARWGTKHELNVGHQQNV